MDTFLQECDIVLNKPMSNVSKWQSQVLVNGADGIGVGWSTAVPNYNPRDLIANVSG